MVYSRAVHGGVPRSGVPGRVVQGWCTQRSGVPQATLSCVLLLLLVQTSGLPSKGGSQLRETLPDHGQLGHRLPATVPVSNPVSWPPNLPDSVRKCRRWTIYDARAKKNPEESGRKRRKRSHSCLRIGWVREGGESQESSPFALCHSYANRRFRHFQLFPQPRLWQA